MPDRVSNLSRPLPKLLRPAYPAPQEKDKNTVTTNSVTGSGVRPPPPDVGSAGGSDLDPGQPQDQELLPGVVQQMDFIEDEPPIDAPWAVLSLDGLGSSVPVNGGGPAGPQPRPEPPFSVNPSAGPTQSGPAPPINSGLGPEIDKLLNLSPTLRDLWAKAQAQGWKIELTNEGKSLADEKSKRLYINVNDVLTQGLGRPAAIASLLAHEIGHAATAYPPDLRGATREEFIQKNVEQGLRHEAAAAMVNLEARAEIAVNARVDIGVRGGLDEFYLDVWDRMHRTPPLTREEAISEIAQYMAEEPDARNGTSKRETLEIYYGDKYDDTHSND
jgi:hypothetical protein